ncbi:hypothetical protein ASF37_09730 [Aeromicrobium sp. Leaf289]|uniref:HtaA domain-containing protein n=2 Tax=unclassified Aeromicrobium TaxID=2633570 RepID=UPI0006F51201|nr:HtaA domain-containing protein [Aeromicrobium sp. Leaf289]KQP78780.1 hypothetical protein ASF37_09730 [Aeromicrobium sp. Leaf289]
MEVVEQVEGSLKVDVEGFGYATTGPGVYLGISESGGASPTDVGAYRGAVLVPSTTMGVGGTFTRTLTLDADDIETLDPTKQYSVYSLKAHGQAATDPSQTVEAPLDIDVAVLKPASEPQGAQLEVKVVEQKKGSLKVELAGSGYATTSPGVYVGISESGGASATDAGAYRGAIWVQASSMGEGGTFERTIELDAAAIATLDPTEDYSVYSLKAHGVPDPGATQSVEKAIDLDVALLQGDDEPVDPGPNGPTLDVSVAEQRKGSLKVAVKGSGYAVASPGVYVAIAPVGGGSTSDASAYVGTEWVQHTQMGAGGTFTVTLAPSASEIATLDPTKEYAVYSLKAHGQAASDPSQTVEVPIDLDVALLKGGVVTPPTPTDPDPGTGPGAGPGAGGGVDAPRTSGSLRWGVKAAFRSYVTGPIANGRVSVSRGASASGGSYRFFQKSTAASGADARGATRYGGTVRFTGHAGALDLSVTDPTVTVRAGRVGTLSAVMAGRRIDVGSVDLARASRTTKAGAVTYSGAPVRLTAAGARAFQGFYSAGEAMDPVTFTIGSDGGAASGGGTVAAAVSTTGFVPPASPPASTGVTLDLADGDTVRAGDRLTASASGFRPGETDIAVVVYSTPVVLERSLSADAQGRARWSGVLPGDLEPGEHTLTFQGSISRGAVFTVADDEEAERCEVADATLTWGVKESFRSYVSGSIANGDWTTSGDASYETPEFDFSGGSGSFDAATTEGDVAFDGAIRFTGHSGALEVVLEDPVVRFTDADTAVLLLDVTAGDRAAAEAGGDAAPTTTEDVPFVELDLSGAEVERSDDGTGYTVTDAPAVLTEQGHGVFGTYEAGTAFDPIDLTVTTAADCAGTAGEASVAPADTTEAAGLAGTTSDSGVPAWWVAVAAALALVVGFGMASLRRRSGGLR